MLSRISLSGRNMLNVARRSMSVSLDGYGEHMFKGAVAQKYLAAAGVPNCNIQDKAWCTDGSADKVAEAVLNWAKDNGASVYCHWFQPMGASGVRHGFTGQVQNAMFEFDNEGNPVWDFKGKNLLQGETDGSSYPNGGLRGTHAAGGYLSIDPTSPIFLRGDTVFIPACLVSYYGHALDEKTPLLRANDALSREGKRLLSKLGVETTGLKAMIGLEQEIFLIPREAYLKRTDLQLTGRTIMGQDAPRGQEMCDHYMAPPSLTSPALACMQEIQEQCFKMGIPLKTRHREVAPNQYEFAPTFGTAASQVDQNLTVMQVIEETAASYGLAALLQEKPFNNVNGSGKHNNWSIFTDCGIGLLNVGAVEKKTGNNMVFPIVMSAIIKAVQEHGDLMRLAIASPGNDFRLGACEAPPAIVSTYLGEQMTNYLKEFSEGASEGYVPVSKELDMGASVINKVTVPAEDRNRTSPFPYGGHRFEFRAVGSAQNVSMVNTVLNTITANAFKEFADAIEAGASPEQVARDALKESWHTIFNGDNYDVANQEMLTKAGVWRIDSGVEAIQRFTAPKNVELFNKMGVFTEEECAARQTVLLDHYTGTVEMEALCMIDMINKHVIPSCKEAGVGPLAALEKDIATIKAAVAAIHAADSAEEKGALARVLRLETMINIRENCDAAEAVCPANLWTLASYKDLLFLDHTLE